MPSSRVNCVCAAGRGVAPRFATVERSRVWRSGRSSAAGERPGEAPGLGVQCARAPGATPCAWVSPSLSFEASSLARVLRPTARGSPTPPLAGRVIGGSLTGRLAARPRRGRRRTNTALGAPLWTALAARFRLSLERPSRRAPLRYEHSCEGTPLTFRLLVLPEAERVGWLSTEIDDDDWRTRGAVAAADPKRQHSFASFTAELSSHRHLIGFSSAP